MPISVEKKEESVEVMTVRMESMIQKTAPSTKLTQNIETERLFFLLIFSCIRCSSIFAPSLEVL
jgi:hypothetical protein